VFICFSGIGDVIQSKEQLREIAVSLEDSGHRFLWVFRAPASDADLDLGAFLSDRFLGTHS
jgi:hypothetical protein